MKAIKETFKFDNITVLVCEMFDDSEVTDKIVTNAGIFVKPDFEVENVKACFGTPTTRNIVIKRTNFDSKIEEFKFA